MIDQLNLMLGNWIYDDILNKEIQINNMPYGLDLTNRSGIVVTKELLERIGFVKHQVLKDRFFWRYWDKEYRYKLDVDFDFCNSDRMWSLHVDNGDCNTIGCGEFTYLHEVQNLVQIITGYPLIIKKEVFYDN